jgi:hypothetical protein
MKQLLKIELNENDDGTKGFTLVTSEDCNVAEALQLVMQQLWLTQAANGPDAVPMNPQPGAPMLSIDDPRWYAELDLSGKTTLAIRHPGIGWLAFGLPQESALLLRQRLEAIQEASQTPGPAH